MLKQNPPQFLCESTAHAIHDLAASLEAEERPVKAATPKFLNLPLRARHLACLLSESCPQMALIPPSLTVNIL
jgi:hypothetical protein